MPEDRPVRDVDRPPDFRMFRRTILVVAYLTAPFLMMVGVPWLGLIWVLCFGLVYVPLVLLWPALHAWFGTCMLSFYLLTSLGIYLIGRRHDRGHW